MIQEPHPWKDSKVRTGLVVGAIAGAILVATNYYCWGLFPALSVLIVYVLVVPSAMTNGYKWGHRTSTKEHIMRDVHYRVHWVNPHAWRHAAGPDGDVPWIDSATWNRAVVVDSEAQEDTPSDPRSELPEQLP